MNLTGSDIIALERSRQIAKEGCSAAHDDAHDRGQLLAAAMCYASVPLLRLTYKGYAAEAEITEVMATQWPWEEEWWKPDNDAVRNLAKAGALIAAEIDRLQRLKQSVMITKKFGTDFNSEGGALTLPVSAVSVHPQDSGTHTRTHESGWTITGEVREDYYTWVNKFEATHPIFGKVWGDFEEEVHADSEQGFADFWKNHEPQAWDYLDI